MRYMININIASVFINEKDIIKNKIILRLSATLHILDSTDLYIQLINGLHEV